MHADSGIWADNRVVINLEIIVTHGVNRAIIKDVSVGRRESAIENLYPRNVLIGVLLKENWRSVVCSPVAIDNVVFPQEITARIRRWQGINLYTVMMIGIV